MQVPPFSAAVLHLAEENRSTVAKLRNIDAELMARIQHRERLHAGRQDAPAEESRELRPRELSRIEIDQLGCCWVGMNEIGRRTERRGIQLCVKGLRKPGIGIVEDERFQCAPSHGSL